VGLLLSITPLSIAVVGGHADVAKALLAAGADADEGVTVGPLGVLRAWTPLDDAAARGHTAAVAALLAGGASPERGTTTLHFFSSTPLERARSGKEEECKRAAALLAAAEESSKQQRAH
jgi:sugar (pentulose or hexulose) kinase